jgi:hypothetical protein
MPDFTKVHSLLNPGKFHHARDSRVGNCDTVFERVLHSLPEKREIVRVSSE